jgi:hypothetical protein
MFDSKLGRRGDTRVMAPERVQPMRVGSSDQRFAKPDCHSFCAAVWVEESDMKMAVFNGVETIYFCKQP